MVTHTYLDTYITIDDILERVPVTARTIRYWVHKGIIPKPVRVSNGYKQGVMGLYPPEALYAALIASSARSYNLDERLIIIQEGENKDWYIINGVLTVKLKGRKNNGQVGKLSTDGKSR